MMIKVISEEDRKSLNVTIEDMERNFARFLCVRKNGHGFEYMQAKAQFALGTLESSEESLKSIGVPEVVKGLNFRQASTYAGFLVNRGKHRNISDKDMGDFQTMYEYFYHSLLELKHLANGGEVYVSDYELERENLS